MPVIIQSPSDKRSHKYIKLDNQMECILVHDPEADKSAASLDVKVGCSLDPKPLYGTAHFLEHMLFMGTEKYPSENEYAEYIKDNGGYNNAFTSLTDTNYHFECSNEALKGALDRFSQFFIAPLLGDSSAEREMKAVDSEYNMSLQNDAWHYFNLIQSLSDKDSALNRFNCGNLESLKQEGIRDALLKFHKDWYSSNIMKLCISGRESLETLEQWAKEMFSAVPNNNVVVPDLGSPAPFTQKTLANLTRFVPIKDQDILTVCWILPYYEMDYRSKPLDYYSHLFGHEGKNSLLSYLMAEDLALELSAGGDHDLWAFSSFEVTVTLTKKGLQEYERVIAAIFQYAQRLKEVGPQRWVFDENRKVGQMKFNYLDKGQAVNYVVGTTRTMQKFNENNIEEVIEHKYLSKQYNEAQLKEVIHTLCDPQNANYFLRSKSFEGKLTQKAAWYSTPYETEKLSEELLARLKNPSEPNTNKKLDLPPQNNMIPDNFDIYGNDPEYSKVPKLLTQEDSYELWFLKDEQFRKPKIRVGMKLYTEDCGFGKTLQGRVFTQVWNSVLEKYLKEFFYMAEMAGMSFSHVFAHDNMQFTWSGYHQKIDNFVRETIAQVKECNSAQVQNEFNQAKEKLVQAWKNSYLDQTFRQAFAFLDTALIAGAFQNKDLLEFVEKYSYDDFIKDRENWLKKGQQLWFVCGNHHKHHVQNFVKDAVNNFGIEKADWSDLADVRCVRIPEGQSWNLDLQVQDKANDNSCLLAYFQGDLNDKSGKRYLLNRIVGQYMDEPTFNQLRTIEQLGYVVFSRPSNLRDLNGLWFLVQSPSKSCEHIVNSLGDHLDTMRKKVKELSDEDFKTSVNAVLTDLSEKDKSIYERFDRFWRDELATGRQDFESQDKQCALLQQIKKKEFQDYFESLFFSESHRRIDLQFHSEAHKPQQEELVKEGKADKKHFEDKNTQRKKAESLQHLRDNLGRFSNPLKERLSKQTNPNAIIEDETYEKNAFVNIDTAKLRKQCIDEVEYKVDLMLPKGNKYGGRVQVNFKLLQKSSKELALDFRGTHIAKLTINGTLVNDEKAFFNHEIILNQDLLKEGEMNTVEMYIWNQYRKDGVGMHSFTDKVDGQQYLYTQFEADFCHYVFPCFDQPDLKAHWTFTAMADEDWTVFSNEYPEDNVNKEREDAFVNTMNDVTSVFSGNSTRIEKPKTYFFGRSDYIATYVYAIVAGAFGYYSKEAEGCPPLRIYARKSVMESVNHEEMFKVTIAGMRFYKDFFGVAYPFNKYCQVFVPEHNYGAMENVGCVTYNEAYLYRNEVPTLAKRLRFSITNLHELAHMWFGNLVTMKWWNDLWLNESFATFMSFLAMSESEELSYFNTCWVTFLQYKFWGISTDQLSTTHSICCEITSTDEAESLFDGISYGKGSAFLKQLHYMLGNETMKTGTANYIKAFAKKNTVLKDYVDHMQQAYALPDAPKNLPEGMNIEEWCDQWLNTSGVNILEPIVEWNENGSIKSLSVKQSMSLRGKNRLRIQRIDIALYDEEMKPHFIEGHITSDKVDVTQVPVQFDGKVAAIFVNANEHGYAKVRFDQKSIDKFTSDLYKVEDHVTRGAIQRYFWQLVMDKQMTSLQYCDFVQQQLPRETVDQIIQVGVMNLKSLIAYYIPEDKVTEKKSALFDLSLQLLSRDDLSKDPIADNIFGFISNKEQMDQALKWLEAGEIKSGEQVYKLQKKHNNSILVQLFKSKDFETEFKQTTLEATLKDDNSDLAQNCRTTCQASLPDAAVKAQIWADLVDPDSKESLYTRRAKMSGFWVKSHSDLTDEYVDKFYDVLVDLNEKVTYKYMETFFYSMLPRNTVKDEHIVKLLSLKLSNPDTKSMFGNILQDGIELLVRSKQIREFAQK